MSDTNFRGIKFTGGADKVLETLKGLKEDRLDTAAKLGLNSESLGEMTKAVELVLKRIGRVHVKVDRKAYDGRIEWHTRLAEGTRVLTR